MKKIDFLRVVSLLLPGLLLLPGSQQRAQAALNDARQACILDLIENASSQLTMGEVRDICDAQETAADASDSAEQDSEAAGLVAERLSVDQTNIYKPFTLMSHRTNYILLAAYNFQDWNAGIDESVYGEDDVNVDNTEVQFQLSVKIPLAADLFQHRIDLFTGYTMRSFWQLYDSENSSPFRETNHEPEFWVQARPQWEFLGIKNTLNILGINHMSNGQAGDSSRSWNRVYAAFTLGRGNFALLVRPWLRIQEGAGDDDNPDITDYYGHGDLWLAYKHEEHTFSLMTRNNIESGFSQGAVELGWSFPIFNYPFLKGYIQYFSGYGESLIDYDRYVNRLGIGLQFTDIL